MKDLNCSRDYQWPCPYSPIWQVLDKDDEWHYACRYHLSQVLERLGGGVVEGVFGGTD